MQQTFAALLFGVSALASNTVFAEERVDTTGFAMTAQGWWSSGTLSLLSDAGGTASIAVKGFDGIEGYEWDATSREDYSPESSNWGNMDFAFDVREGYRITSMTLTGTLTGVLDPGVPSSGGSIGVTTNEFFMGWSFGQGDQSISMARQTLKNVHGDQQLQLSADVPFEGDFTVAVNNGISAYAESGVGYW